MQYVLSEYSIICIQLFSEFGDTESWEDKK